MTMFQEGDRVILTADLQFAGTLEHFTLPKDSIGIVRVDFDYVGVEFERGENTAIYFSALNGGKSVRVIDFCDPIYPRELTADEVQQQFPHLSEFADLVVERGGEVKSMSVTQFENGEHECSFSITGPEELIAALKAAVGIQIEQLPPGVTGTLTRDTEELE